MESLSSLGEITAKRDPFCAAWKQEEMEPAEKRDLVLKKGQQMQLRLELLLSGLASCIFPKMGNEKKEAMVQHQQLMSKVLLPFIEASVNFAKYYKEVQAHHHEYAIGLCKYIFPPGDKAAGPFILKQGHNAKAGVHHIVKHYHLVVQHSALLQDTNDKMKKACVEVIKDRILSSDSKPRKKSSKKKMDRKRSSQKRVDAQEQASRSYNTPDYLCYEVFHGALAATTVS